MLIKFFLVVIIGMLIGWITNYIAIKMLFRPYKEINLFFFKIQGVIPRRRHEIGINIARTIKNDVISMEDIINSIDKDKIGEHLEKIVDKILKSKVEAELLRVFPMAAMFLSESVMEKINNGIKKMIMENKDVIIEEMLKGLESEVDFETIIVKNVDSFSVEKLEEITFNLAKKEFKHIEIIGAILGGIIGAIQGLIGSFM